VRRALTSIAPNNRLGFGFGGTKCHQEAGLAS
jgi:hypothetical protein